MASSDGASAAERGAIFAEQVAIGDSQSIRQWIDTNCLNVVCITSFCAYQSSMPLPRISGFAHCTRSPHENRTLGAGHIGHTIARLLVESGDYQLTVVDQSKPRWTNWPARCQHRRGRHQQRQRTGSRHQGHDAVINALPYHLAIRIATAAKNVGCHYFDLTEDVAATKAIMAMADGAGTAFMPQCGLAPGFIGIVAHHLAQGFDSLDEIKMRVGALPFPHQRPQNTT